MINDIVSGKEEFLWDMPAESLADSSHLPYRTRTV